MNYQLQPGYAFVSRSKRPNDPETIMLTHSDCAGTKHVGEALIDGSRMIIFRVADRNRYYFQLPQNCRQGV